MLATYPLLKQTDFPPIQRAKLDTLQVNLGYYCNLSCKHCHVNAGPKRTEMMSRATAEQVVDFMQRADITTLDLTGGAPELNSQFQFLVTEAHRLGVRIIDRCNLVVLMEEGQEGLADFLAAHDVDVVASLPCYLEENVNAQRGKGVFDKSILGLQALNARGYGLAGSQLSLDLVFNPQDAVLPPPQQALEVDYKRFLSEHFGIQFNSLLTLANMPIQRFGSMLISKGKFHDYMELLKSSHSDQNIPSVMCRSTLSVDYDGRVYDCDFNQMLNMPMGGDVVPKTLADITPESLAGHNIAIADHCYGCTAGQGSSCGGALA